MKIIYLNIDRAFSFNPFIVLPSRMKAWMNPSRQAAFAHEIVHFDRQSFLPIFWVIRYFLSKKFRFQEEVLAYQKQLEVETLSASPARRLAMKKYLAGVMAEQYWGMCTYEEAFKELK